MAINRVGSKGIEDGAVATADLQDNVVTSAKLGDGEVTNAKLANTTVTLAGQSITLGASGTLANKFVDWQTVITAAGSSNTAVSGQGYFIDTTSAVHTVTLPASAAIGDFIAIKDYAGTFATNNLTIARNGHNIQGVANDSLISTNRASLVLVYVDSTKGWLYWEEHNVADLTPAFTQATGGTVTTSGDFKIHTFTGDGNFVVSQIGSAPTNPLGGPANVEYLVVAGGGSGGRGSSSGRGGGGGGAGGFRTNYPSTPSFPITTQTYPITVGAGGSYTNGSNSIFSTITSAGGGYGSGHFTPSQGANGNPGGSGGGAMDDNNATTGGSGNTPPVSPPQGNNGGGSAQAVPGNAGGGGGGAGSAGATAAYPQPGSSAGGNGVSNSITASSVTYSSGGTGGPINGGADGPAGASNSGDGGDAGAGSGPGAGGAGGSGIVVIRYKFQ